MRFPKFLKKNGTIGFAAPSFGCNIEPYKSSFDHALEKFHALGYQTDLGPNCYEGSGIGISNTPKLCAEELMSMYLSKKNDVIISCGGAAVPDNTVTQAAQLAAYYAETGGGQNIPVDVTRVKQVKKIPSGKPGMVIYHTYRTVVANPYPDIRIDPLNAEKTDD